MSRNGFWTSLGLAVVAGAALRVWFLFGLHDYYYQGGTLAWQASHALSLLDGKPFRVDDDFVRSLQKAQASVHRIIDPGDFLKKLPHRPKDIWPDMDVLGLGFLAAAFWHWRSPSRGSGMCPRTPSAK